MLTESPVLDNFSLPFHNQVASPSTLGCSSPAVTVQPTDGPPKICTNWYFDSSLVEKSSNMTCPNAVVEKNTRRPLRADINFPVAGNPEVMFRKPRNARFIGRAD